MSKLRVNKTKVLRGGAMKRTNPSKAAEILVNLDVLGTNVLDYGCGYGFDAAHYGWSSYDPYYNDIEITETYENVVCINVLNVVSSKIRKEIIENIKSHLTETGIAYLYIPRNVPIKGKFSGFERRPQNYVVLSLKSIYKDNNGEIYELNKNDIVKDTTINIGE